MFTGLLANVFYVISKEQLMLDFSFKLLHIMISWVTQMQIGRLMWMIDAPPKDTASIMVTI